MTVVRELIVLLGYEVDEKTFAAAVKSYDRMKTVALGVTGAVAAVTGAVVAATLATAKHGDEIDDVSQRLGVNAETLQELEHAAKMGGASTDIFRASLAFLSRQLGEANQGSKESLKNFAALGIKTKDVAGKARPMDEVMGDLADKVSKIQDPTKKSALVIRALGKSGLAMVPMLNAGRAGIERLRQEARDLGIVMSEDSTKAAAEFSDELDRNTASLMGLVHSVAGEFLPAARDLLRVFRAWFVENRAIIAQDMKEAFLAVADGIRVASKVLLQLWRASRQIIDAFGGLRRMALFAAAAVGFVLLGSIGKMAALLTGKGVFSVNALAKALARFAMGPVLVGAKFLGLAAIVFLVFEDIATFIRGGDSLLGRFIDHFMEPPDGSEHWLIGTLRTIVRFIGEASEKLARFFGVLAEKEDADMMIVRHQKSTKRGGSGGFRSTRFSPGGGPSAGPMVPAVSASVPGGGTGGVSIGQVNTSVKVDATGHADPQAVGRAVVDQVKEGLESEIRKAAVGASGVVER